MGSRLLGVVLALGAAAARADDTIPEVTLSQEGPNRSIPVGSQFYLTGSVGEDVDVVQPILVRKSTRFLIGGDGTSCEALERDLGKLRAGKNSEVLVPFEPGVVPDTAVWTNTASDNGKVLVTGAWMRKSGADKTFKVLVDGKGPYFKPAGSFCLFVYQRTTKRTQDMETVKEFLLEARRELDACETKFPATDETLEKKRTECLLAAEKARDAKLKELEAKAPDPTGKAWVEGLRASVNVTHVFTSRPRKIAGIFASWTRGKLVADSDLRAPLPISTDLGRGLALLLAFHNQLTVGANGDFFAGTTRIDAINLLADGEVSAQLLQPRTGETKNGKPIAFDKRLGVMKLPGRETTAQDVVELTRGRILVGKRWHGIAELRDVVMPLVKATGPLSAEDGKRLDEALGAIGALDSTIEWLTQRARTEKVGAEAQIDKALGVFLAKLTVRCDVEMMKGWVLDPAEAKSQCKADKDSEGWTGWVAGQSPFAHLWVALSEIRAARAEWAQLSASLALETKAVKAVPVAAAIEAKVAFTQDLWVFSFVTPVTGYVLPLIDSQHFTMHYFAVQVHWAPNPVDEPQWSQGLSDLWRFVALELGIGSELNNFGPDGRYSGWQSLPPLLVAVAVHLIPYTSISFGAMFFERRNSTVAQQSYAFTIAPFLGANVQINLPELVMALKGRTSTTQSAK